jgi:carbamoyltransferase
MPHSLGLLYEAVTQHLGFLGSSDEYKVMALAALGRPRLREALQALIRIESDGRYRMAPFAMNDLFGPPRALGEPIGQPHLDIAASLQQVLEETVLALAGWLARTTGERHLTMAGGVALNCLANARVRDSGIFDGVWVQPAAGDAGTALGAALWIDGCLRGGASPDTDPGTIALGPRRWTMDHAYWGPSYDDTQIGEALRFAKLPDTPAPDLVEACVQRLADGELLGWFQGRMEFGPRALGARSILASPIDPAMQQRLNALKDREDFRPVAPVVPQERLADWFEPAEANGGASPFMLFTYRVRPDRAARIPSALHADGTARVQTVTADSHPLLHRLLTRFGERTGVPVLVNTSFNVRGEPIVATPRAALEAFYGTPLDALAIGPHVLGKAT